VNRRAKIGFDRRIDLEWLDAISARVAAGADVREARQYVWQLLDGVVRGATSKSARGKTLTVLSHIWSEVPELAAPLRTRAIAELRIAAPEERLAIHWAMMIGTYPAFADVATAAGKLLALQGSFSLAMLTKRMVDAWGGRSTMVRAAQRIVRSMVQWGVLVDTPTRGTYRRGAMRKVGAGPARVLIEAVLVDSRASALPVEQAVGHPSLFPFELCVDASHLRKDVQFLIHRQGWREDVIELAPLRETDPPVAPPSARSLGQLASEDPFEIAPHDAEGREQFRRDVQ
jgi:hypothetical protein